MPQDIKKQGAFGTACAIYACVNTGYNLFDHLLGETESKDVFVAVSDSTIEFSGVSG